MPGRNKFQMHGQRLRVNFELTLMGFTFAQKETATAKVFQNSRILLRKLRNGSKVVYQNINLQQDQDFLPVLTFLYSNHYSCSWNLIES